MGKNTLTALLKDLRALILKSRPAYRDFLGEVTELRTTKILENVVLSENVGTLSPSDPTFAGLVAGKTYRAVVNGEEIPVIAVAGSKDGEISIGYADGNNYWAIYEYDGPVEFEVDFDGTYAGATISVYYDEMVTEQKWSVKKLAYELLPDRLFSALSAAANTARKALTAANDAQRTASAAQRTADTAQGTADSALNIADSALPKTGGNISGSVDVSNDLSAGEVIIRASRSENVYTVLSCKNEEVGEVSCIGFARSNGVAEVSIGNTGYTAGTIKSARVSLELGKNRGITFSHDGNAYHMRCGGPLDFSTGDSVNGWSPIQVQGIIGIIMRSSTSGSTKKFKITVDDTGTLSATEVTDTTT